MKIKHWKLFWDYEKEEKWLNEKAAKGLAMVSYAVPGRYTFEECQPGEYAYRIELLEHGASNPESLRYIRFIEEQGVEHVDTYLNWVYFRKPADSGPFEIYSDLDARLKHYRRVARLYLTIACIELCLASSQIGIFHTSLMNGSKLWIVSVVTWSIVLTFTLICFWLWRRYCSKIKQITCERALHE